MPHAHAVSLRPLSASATAKPGEFEVTAVHTAANSATVQLHGELDLANADLLVAVLDNQLQSGHRYLRLDLSGVTFLDCAGLHAILHAHNNFLAGRGSLVLTGIGARIARLLCITELEKALFIADGPGEPFRTRRAWDLSAVSTG